MAVERRIYPREDLTAAMICECHLQFVTTHCVVKNVSLDGVLLECPLAEQLECGFEIGTPVVLNDILEGDSALLRSLDGTIVWVYKRFIGVHFTKTLMDCPEQLLAWLEERRLA